MVVKTNVSQVVRGNQVTFTTSFYTANNQLVTAGGANLTVTYHANLVSTSNTISMTTPDGGNTWVGTWNSSGIEPGIIDWYIKSTDTSSVAEQGSLRLIANEANL
jgi:hypothetical protein